VLNGTRIHDTGRLFSFFGESLGTWKSHQSAPVSLGNYKYIPARPLQQYLALLDGDWILDP
jgi:hypothetical protein